MMGKAHLPDQKMGINMEVERRVMTAKKDLTAENLHLEEEPGIPRDMIAPKRGLYSAILAAKVLKITICLQETGLFHILKMGMMTCIVGVYQESLAIPGARKEMMRPPAAMTMATDIQERVNQVQGTDPEKVRRRMTTLEMGSTAFPDTDLG